MLRFAIVLFTVLGLSAAPALSETMRVSAPSQAASLHEGALDMVAYYRATEGDVMEVTTTFSERTGFVRPTRVVMGLLDGGKVAFSVPGYPESLYRFSRIGGELKVSVQLLDFVEVAQIN